jgi:uncharacterized protein YegP (UPF0339 family)
MPIPDFIVKVYRAKSGRWHWNMRSRGNRRVIMDSAEGYASKANAVRAVYRAPLAWVEIGWDERT